MGRYFFAMNKIIYDKKFLRCIKTLALLADIILTLAIIRQISDIRQPDLSRKEFYSCIYVIIEDGISFLAFILLFFFPHRLELMTICCYTYALPLEQLLFHGDESMMWILMFCMGCLTLFVRGFFMKHRKEKITVTAIFFLIIFCGYCYTNKEFLFSYATEVFGHVFVLSSIIFFLVTALWKKDNPNEIKTLNLAKYPGLKDYDASVLQQVLDGKFYKQIDLPNEIAKNSLTVHLNRIYKKLGVADKTGFIATYHGWKMIYDSSSDDEED